MGKECSQTRVYIEQVNHDVMMGNLFIVSRLPLMSCPKIPQTEPGEYKSSAVGCEHSLRCRVFAYGALQLE